MYVSVRGRVWLEVEAANMVESVGNYVKHRRVPVVVKEKDGNFMTFFVPSISGESVAHSYQLILAEALKKKGQKVCKYCEKGIFLKSTNKEIYKEVTGNDPPKSGKKGSESVQAANEIEENIIKSCGVEDVGGFLFAENPNVKRTSAFSTGYMIPVKESLSVTSIDPQLHSRYALGTKFVNMGEESSSSGQMIYYVEVSSAMFSFSFDIDTKFIGKYTFSVDNYGKVIKDMSENDVKSRIEASLEALKRFLLEFPVGAKRTRFNPSDVSWDSIGIAVSNEVWTMPSSFTEDYLKRARIKREKVSYETEIHAYSENTETKEEVSPNEMKSYDSAEEAIVSAIENAEKRVSAIENAKK
ncbi:CRISPR-associated protein Cas7/Csa2 1 [Sulfuracidifex tepidarius]|uniref:CRISPR-associated protein Cas7/Csa2 1 n=1 Tax=Sulfuracidifex tepidarius TaxID=1294262 RepID=A0A510DYD3_9CREN|nr:type I-A CRISPR-associated protein Cas7/Csa2 [Sulfuracidifex tepidarius]BBG24970.1 CRISPR-associated protein Cas7/Csa2 1 [Sulfuracidifex tepidarius]